MIRRLRLRRLASLRRGMIGYRVRHHGAEIRPALGALGQARHPGHPRAVAVHCRLCSDAHVVDLPRVEARGRGELDAAGLGEDALGIAQLPGGGRRPALVRPHRHLVLLGDDVVGQGALENGPVHPPVAEKPVLLKQLDGDPETRGDAAVDGLQIFHRDDPEEHDVDGHLMVVEVDVQVADAQLGLRGQAAGQRQDRRDDVGGQNHHAHTARTPL